MTGQDFILSLSIVSGCLFTALFAFLFFIYKQECARSWALAYLAYTLSFFMAYHYGNTLIMGYFLMFLLLYLTATTSLFWGIRDFVQWSGGKFTLYGSIVVAVLATGGHVLGLNLLYLPLPIWIAFLFIIAGVVLLKGDRRIWGLYPAALGLILSSILYTLNWFAPSDNLFILNGVAGFIVSLGLLLAFFQNLHHELLILQEAQEISVGMVRSLMKVIPDTILHLASDGTVQSIYGQDSPCLINRNDALGKKVEEVLSPEVGPHFLKKRQSLQAGGYEELLSFEMWKGEDLLSYEAKFSLQKQGAMVVALRDCTKRRRMEMEKEYNMERLQKLNTFALGLSQIHEENDIYSQALEGMEVILGFPFSALALWEEGILKIKASKVEEYGIDAVVSLDTKSQGNSLKQGNTLFIDENIGGEKNTSSLIVPLQKLGALIVSKMEENSIQNNRLGLLKVLADHTAAAILRCRSEAQSRYMSFHDGLTGLYNRVYFEEEMERLNTPRNFPLALILGDINDLKLINDVYGHEQGDALLQAVAGILKSCIRQDEIVCRWGGDEFALLLPRTSREEAAAVCERIREVARQTKVGKFPVFLAMGISMRTEVEESNEEFMKRAETRMYSNKMEEDLKGNILNHFQHVLSKNGLETPEHIQAVASYGNKLAVDAQLTQGEKEDLEKLALYHDIGMVALDEKLLQSGATLSREEWQRVKTHPETGYRIAVASPALQNISRLILYHHERWDGSGYPQGLQGRDIPLLCRILAIADAYDVMLRGRPYQKAKTKEQARAELMEHAGYQFDPGLIERFIKIVEE